MPAEPRDIDSLLATSLGLDVWERHETDLVVAADDAQLDDVERRMAATVVRIASVEEYAERQGQTERTEEDT